VIAAGDGANGSGTQVSGLVHPMALPQVFEPRGEHEGDPCLATCTA